MMVLVTTFLANASTRDSIFNLYLFDIRMYTQLTMSGTPSGGTTVGSKVTGTTSGATGFIHCIWYWYLTNYG